MTYCHHHDPDRAEERSLAASRAAKARHHDSELGPVKARLKELAEGVVAGQVTTARGSVAAQLYGVYLRAVEAERRIKETEELEERLRLLEEAQQRGGYSWGV